MEKGFLEIIDSLPQYQQGIAALKDRILANLVMISELPSPSFKEHKRMDFLLQSFSDSNLQNCSTDEVGNAMGILPGTDGEQNILMVAHMDSLFQESIDHTITVTPNEVIGPGVGDNALGLACLITIPLILEQLNLQLRSNLILMGSSRSLGRGDIEGLRFFLSNTNLPMSAGICVEGVKLGRLSYSSIGMLRCEISYKVPEKYDWTRFGAVGSIVTINEVINRILEIPLPRRPRTTIVLGSIEGGTSFNTIAKEAVLRFEIRSESDEMVKKLKQEIESIAAEISSHTGADVNFNIYAQRRPGGIQFSHPLAVHARYLLESLQIKPRISPSTSELSAFIARNIPAATVGLTDGDDMGSMEENIEIQPIFKGITQLIGLILAIDRGYCYENQ